MIQTQVPLYFTIIYLILILVTEISTAKLDIIYEGKNLKTNKFCIQLNKS
jgi:hypothetical protein